MDTLDKALDPIAESFYDLAERLDRAEMDPNGLECILIRVEMNFETTPFSVKVVRHIRNPEKLFDSSRDREIELPVAEKQRLEAQVDEYYQLSIRWKSKPRHTTLTIWPNRTWSFGSTS